MRRPTWRDFYREFYGLVGQFQEQKQRLSELERVLRLVDEDVRHHLRSDEIAPALLRPHAIRAVREVLGGKASVVGYDHDGTPLVRAGPGEVLAGARKNPSGEEE